MRCVLLTVAPLLNDKNGIFSPLTESKLQKWLQKTRAQICSWNWGHEVESLRIQALKLSRLGGKRCKLRYPPPSGIWCISVLKWHRLAEYSMQYEMHCTYFVQKVEGTENKTVCNPKKWGDMPPPGCAHDERIRWILSREM